MKRPYIKCQYCGSQAYLRPASVLNKTEKADADAMFYVCARYPVCDAYVTANAGNLMPMGTLANRQLRQKRRAAHVALNRLWQSNIMTRKEAYRWLQLQLGVEEEDAHIARFLDYRCDETIRLCESFVGKCRRAEASGKIITEEGEHEHERTAACNAGS